ncbi:NADH dehydrogenase (ubiquinone) B18 subunit [Brevipalpus obovatus]|uniref:NADH dehydrogenase (ubiquinone) B18 subunit n=1 Tax=Brevipalpus obovatus TaxID=246614 RepID=UPI003D9FA4AD
MGNEFQKYTNITVEPGTETFGNLLWKFTFPHKRGEPFHMKESKYDPLYGFPRGRHRRESPISYAEAISSRIPPRHNDYCAHFWLKHAGCVKENFPYWFRCNPYKWELLECQYQDKLLQLKEYERERRLDKRNKRILEKMRVEELAKSKENM